MKRSAIALLGLLPLSCLAQPQALACNEFSMGGVEQALRTRPGHDRACHELGMALIRQSGRHDQRLQQAELIFKTLLRLRPRSPFAYLGFAELKMRRRELGLPTDGSIDVIRQEADRASRIRPEMPEALVTLGRADLLAGCLPCARRSAERASALGVDSPELAVLRSRIAELSGKPDEAHAVLERAIGSGLAPEPRSWLLVSLAELRLRRGKLTLADRSFADAADADPDNLDAVIRRAEVRLFWHGDLAGALELGAASPRAAASIEIKRMRSIARYLTWARERIAGRAAEDLGRIAQASYVSPEAALVACARHPALAQEFKAMLEAGVMAHVDARDEVGDTALLAAVQGGNVPVARLLVARAADVNAEDRRSRRPLSYVTGGSELLVLLLNAGAVVDYVDKDGRSPLVTAVQKRDAAAVALLLGNRHRAGRATALLPRAGDLLATAAMSDDTATLKLLLDSGIPVESVDGAGRTALVVAVLWESRSAVRLLLGHGADASKALDVARERGDAELIELLNSSRRHSA
jgi:hypothetical protein